MNTIIKSSLWGSFAALVLLGLLQPFGIDRIQEGRLMFIVGQAGCTFVALLVTNAFLWYFFPRLYDQTGDKLGTIMLKMVPMFLLVSIVMGEVILMYDCAFEYGDVTYGWYDGEGRFTLLPYFSVLRQVLLISFFIYIWFVYKAYNDNLRDEVSELRALNQLLEERQASTSADKQPLQDEAPTTCRLVSNNNLPALEVNPKDIIYVESMANYADICHIVEGETRHTTLRTTMKQLRETLVGAENLVACHRAFIVNLDFIVSISSRPSGGYQLQIFGTDKQIPVSRSYTDEIKQKMK